MNLKHYIKTHFPALTHRSFCLFWMAQAVSLMGTWMQNLSLPWLIYSISDSAFILGLAGTLQYLPMMILSPFAGALVDRLNRKAVVITTQSILMCISLLISILCFTHTVSLVPLLIIGVVMGLVGTLDVPARQTMVGDIVGKEHLTNAIALNSTVFNAARIFGPAIAGLVMGLWGIAWCFLINALSFIPPIIVLSRLKTIKREQSKKESLWISTLEGVKYALQNRRIRTVLIAVALMGIFAFNYSVLLPVLVKKNFHLGEAAFGGMLSAMGIGSFFAALFLAARSSKGPWVRILSLSPLVTTFLLFLLAFSPWYAFSTFTMVIVGFFNVAFFTTANSYLQTSADEEYRGRVVSLYSLLFGGMTPFGNFISGSLTEAGGPSLGFAGTAFMLGLTFLALGISWMVLKQKDQKLRLSR